MNEKKIKFKFYSEEFFNKEAANNNYIVKVIYGFIYPLSYIFYKLKLTPNTLTWLSILSCAFGCYGLFIENIKLFILFWSLSILFDFCDGTVARMSNNLRKNLLRFDHYSDLCKFSAVILSIALYYETSYYWIFSFVCSFMYLFYTILDHDVVHQIIKVRLNNKNQKRGSKLRDNFKIIRFITANNFLFSFVKLFMPFFIINGHTLIIFLFMPLSINFAYFGLLYLIILTFIGINLRLGLLRSALKI